MTTANNNNGNFSSWTEQLEHWQQLGAMDDTLLVEHTRRQRRQAALGLIAGWLAALCFAVVCAVLFAQRSDSPPLQAMMIFGGGFALLAMTLYTRAERNIARVQHNASTTAHIAELRSRCESDVRTGLTLWPYALLVGFLGAWLPWMFGSDPNLYLQPGFVAVVLMGLVVLIGGALGLQIRKRRQDERKALVLAEIEAELTQI